MHLCQRKQTTNYKKQCLPIITRNKKTFIEVVPITSTLEKRVSAIAPLLMIHESFFFRQSKKSLEYTSMCVTFFRFQGKRRPNKYC